ncbi:DUF1294 domain-containing protein [Cohnella pontilimi]|uniref:DUF1294 domain-containing protein n=1 Tax=Cohnella pontilimi TaxID=2564100 RepID=A0A4U0FFP3_9BACL|nr:DUF1294 domain-containing protein [Cohnella pontilimi]TJY42182.1 DUF1294 domain-containing protein [Cohnella pontilimi]
MLQIWIYLAFINATAYALMSFDKAQARRGGRRIAERTLLTTAAAGGSLGAWIAMRSRRHKTKHAAFAAGIPLMLAIHIGILAYWLSR